MELTFDDERIEVFLPPVGYVVDRMPDPKTGKPSGKLIKSEILFDDLPKKDQKWKRTPLPPEWKKWIKEENAGLKADPNYNHHELNSFRAQEWRRRINGVWIAIGNRHNKPSEYVYLTGLAYFYFNWWIADFGHPRFRMVYLKLFYALCWSDDNPEVNGLTVSTLRRFGKTAIAFCWQFEYISRNRFVYGGMQAKIRDDARLKFRINVVEPWKRLPEFFRPKYYDRTSKYVNILSFIKTAATGENAEANFEDDNALNSHIDYRESKATAYDQAKVHRYVAEEPGKWEEADVYSTVRKVIPATKDRNKIIGKIFAPTTVEELDKGGASYVELAEDSLPSQYYKVGSTKSGLVFLFIPAYEGYLFDEFGRSVIDDPKVKTIDEDGEVLTEGSKTALLRKRKILEGDLVALSEEMRKYPFSWSEAKSVSNQFCLFNSMILQKRIQELERLEKPLWVRGNLEPVIADQPDGDIEFFRDDHSGRFQFAWLPDEHGSANEGDTKVTNNVGEDWDDDGKKVWFPKNDEKFCIGSDPIRYDVTDDPRASKAAAYGFRKLDVSKDGINTPIHKWESYRPIVQYLHRPPEFDIYAEDMIKLCRFLGCSILPEDNVNTLRKHFDMRGYGRFILYRRDFSDEVLQIDKEGVSADKGVGTYGDGEVIDTGMNLANNYFNRHIDKIVFVELLKDALVHRLQKGKRKDSVMGFLYTLLANKAIVQTQEESEEVDMTGLDFFPVFDQSGNRSTLINHREQWKKTA